LRAAVEAIVMAPWLPPEAYAFAHPVEAERMLREAGLLDGKLQLPPQRGSFQSACGGSDQPYPGGMAVHAWAELVRARGIGDSYQRVHGVKLRDDWLVAASLWHDALEAATLPWRDDASCGPEQRIAGAGAHHVLGLAAALLRHLPEEIVLTIASAQAGAVDANAHAVCDSIRAASIIANGRTPSNACSAANLPFEAYVMSLAESDRLLASSAWSWYAAHTPSGWERFEALIQDGSDIAAWTRAVR
jgi:hypothetical protein